MRRAPLHFAPCWFALAAVFCLPSAVRADSAGDTPTYIRNESKLASTLVEWGFADYGQRVIDRLETQHPDAKVQTAVVRVVPRLLDSTA